MSGAVARWTEAICDACGAVSAAAPGSDRAAGGCGSATGGLPGVGDRPRVSCGGEGGGQRHRWERLDLEEQRAVIDTMLVVSLLRVGPSRRFGLDHLHLAWRTGCLAGHHATGFLAWACERPSALPDVWATAAPCPRLGVRAAVQSRVGLPARSRDLDTSSGVGGGAAGPVRRGDRDVPEPFGHDHLLRPRVEHRRTRYGDGDPRVLELRQHLSSPLARTRVATSGIGLPRSGRWGPRAGARRLTDPQPWAATRPPPTTRWQRTLLVLSRRISESRAIGDHIHRHHP